MRFTVEQGLDDLIRSAEAWSLAVTVERPTVEVEIDEHHIAAFLQELARNAVRYTRISLFKPTLEDYFIMLARRRNGNAGGEQDPAPSSSQSAGNGRALSS